MDQEDQIGEEELVAQARRQTTEVLGAVTGAMEEQSIAALLIKLKALHENSASPVTPSITTELIGYSSVGIIQRIVGAAHVASSMIATHWEEYAALLLLGIIAGLAIFVLCYGITP